ncbi:MAG: hypothetical protein O9353_15560 [Bacteroidia bacterium]|jgi:hypothetical protein|nr:hypothetical protein [Bacteroidia bacterium]
MLRFVFIIIVSVVFSNTLASQTKENHYRIVFHSVNAQSKADMEAVLYKITGATAIRYEPRDSSFALSTERLLDKQVISGKLLKHYFPVRYITHLETDIDPFPVMRNSGDREADAIEYEKQKQAWVKKYPDAYKTLLEKK